MLYGSLSLEQLGHPVGCTEDGVVCLGCMQVGQVRSGIDQLACRFELFVIKEQGCIECWL